MLFKNGMTPPPPEEKEVKPEEKESKPEEKEKEKDKEVEEKQEVKCVPSKGFGSGVCDTIYTIYLSLSLYTNS